MGLHKTVNGVEVPLTAEEEEEFYAREQEHARFMAEQSKLRYQKDRQAEYPSIDEIVVALIEDQEGRPQALQEIQSRRAAIKLKYPKPQ